ncbi:Unknown protein, partial [Striga hermonthica]
TQRKQKERVTHATASEIPPPAQRKKLRRNPVRTQTEPPPQSTNDHGSQIHRERNLAKKGYGVLVSEQTGNIYMR